jgi:hypothetical protein
MENMEFLEALKETMKSNQKEVEANRKADREALK